VLTVARPAEGAADVRVDEAPDQVVERNDAAARGGPGQRSAAMKGDAPIARVRTPDGASLILSGDSKCGQDSLFNN
jgi:hypothetical protein